MGGFPGFPLCPEIVCEIGETVEDKISSILVLL